MIPLPTVTPAKAGVQQELDSPHNTLDTGMRRYDESG